MNFKRILGQFTEPYHRSQIADRKHFILSFISRNGKRVEGGLELKSSKMRTENKQNDQNEFGRL